MHRAWRRLRSWVISTSIVAHLGLIAAADLHRSTLTISIDPGGPPQAIIPWLMLPQPPSGHGVKLAPIALHRRPHQSGVYETPIAPIQALAIKPTESPQPVQMPPSASQLTLLPAATPDALRATPGTKLGCRVRGILSLTREERSVWMERPGRGAREETYLAAAISADKQAPLEAAGAAKMARKLTAARALPGAAPDTGKAELQDDSGQPDVATNAVATPLHPPSMRAAKRLGRLPPWTADSAPVAQGQHHCTFVRHEFAAHALAFALKLTKDPRADDAGETPPNDLGPLGLCRNPPSGGLGTPIAKARVSQAAR